MRRRTLHDPATGKSWGTRCEGETVTVTAGAPGREKATTKTLANAKAALEWAEKEEWSRLKKGFLLVDSNASPGEPRMHVHLGGGYTGALALAAVEGRLLCNRNATVQRGVAGDDELVSISPDGAMARAASAPPKHLVWEAVYVPEMQRVLLRCDRTMHLFDPKACTVEPLGIAGSLLAVSGTRIVRVEPSELSVRDLGAGDDVLRLPVAAEIVSGSTQMCAALSEDGSRLALCHRKGEVDLFDVASGARTTTWSCGFSHVEKLAFSGRWLVARGTQGHWTLRAFDLVTNAPRADWAEAARPWEDARACHAFVLDAGRLVVMHGKKITVFDLATMSSLLGFTADHVVRSGALAWFGPDTIAVRTDYGAVSLYAL